jgi:hypothetical protein
MSRASTLLVVLLSVAAAFPGAGCSSPAQPRQPLVAIAIRPVDNRPPSTDETRLTYEALQPALRRAGASVAARGETADFVMTVSFIPAVGSSGPRVKVMSVEPTARFREGSQEGETPEMKEWRRRVENLASSDNSSPPGTSPSPP